MQPRQPGVCWKPFWSEGLWLVHEMYEEKTRGNRHTWEHPTEKTVYTQNRNHAYAWFLFCESFQSFQFRFLHLNIHTFLYIWPQDCCSEIRLNVYLSVSGYKTGFWWVPAGRTCPWCRGTARGYSTTPAHGSRRCALGSRRRAKCQTGAELRSTPEDSL